MGRKLLIGVLVLLVVAAGVGIGCTTGVSQAEYDAVVAERDTLQAQLDALQGDYDTLQAQLDALQGDYDSLQDLLDTLQADVAQGADYALILDMFSDVGRVHYGMEAKYLTGDPEDPAIWEAWWNDLTELVEATGDEELIGLFQTYGEMRDDPGTTEEELMAMWMAIEDYLVSAVLGTLE